MVFIKDGQEFLPGIQAISAPGHTVGHTIYMITSDGKSLAAVGDLTHHQVLLLEKPRIEFAFDTDPKQSANTRVRVLDMLAANKIPLIAYHFPWPGIGHVAKQGRRLSLLSNAPANGHGPEDLIGLQDQYFSVAARPAVARAFSFAPQRPQSKLVHGPGLAF